MSFFFLKKSCQTTRNIISVSLCFAFLIQSSTFAAPSLSASAPAVSLHNENSLIISQDIGVVRDQFDAGEGRPLVYYIQDAHGSTEAQGHISDLIEQVTSGEERPLVLLEGASKRLEPDLYRFFPEDELNRRVANKLVLSGELSGAELFLLKNKTAAAFGIEDPALYDQNLALYRQVVSEGVDLKRSLESLYTGLNEAVSRIVNSETRSSIKIWHDWRRTKKNLEDVLNLIDFRFETEFRMDLHDVRHQNEYPMLVRLFKIRELQSKIDWKRAETEQEKLVRFLSEVKAPADLISALSAWDPKQREDTLPRLGANAPRRLVESIYAETHGAGFRFDDYPILLKVWAFKIFESELDGEALNDEVAGALDKILSKMLIHPEEKRAANALDNAILLDSIGRLELTRKQYEASKGLLDTAESGSLCLVFGFDRVVPEWCAAHETETARLLSQMLEFYRLAELREYGMFQRAMRFLEDRSNAPSVLVTGGFHADGLKRMMKENHISFFEILPRISEWTDSASIYRQAILETSQIRQMLRMEPADDGRRSLIHSRYRVAQVIAAMEEAGIPPEKINSAALGRLFRSLGLDPKSRPEVRIKQINPGTVIHLEGAEIVLRGLSLLPRGIKAIFWVKDRQSLPIVLEGRRQRRVPFTPRLREGGWIYSLREGLSLKFPDLGVTVHAENSTADSITAVIKSSAGPVQVSFENLDQMKRHRAETRSSNEDAANVTSTSLKQAAGDLYLFGPASLATLLIWGWSDFWIQNWFLVALITVFVFPWGKTSEAISNWGPAAVKKTEIGNDSSRPEMRIEEPPPLLLVDGKRIPNNFLTHAFASLIRIRQWELFHFRSSRDADTKSLFDFGGKSVVLVPNGKFSTQSFEAADEGRPLKRYVLISEPFLYWLYYGNKDRQVAEQAARSLLTEGHIPAGLNWLRHYSQWRFEADTITAIDILFRRIGDDGWNPDPQSEAGQADIAFKKLESSFQDWLFKSSLFETAQGADDMERLVRLAEALRPPPAMPPGSGGDDRSLLDFFSMSTREFLQGRRKSQIERQKKRLLQDLRKQIERFWKADSARLLVIEDDETLYTNDELVMEIYDAGMQDGTEHLRFMERAEEFIERTIRETKHPELLEWNGEEEPSQRWGDIFLLRLSIKMATARPEIRAVTAEELPDGVKERVMAVERNVQTVLRDPSFRFYFSGMPERADHEVMIRLNHLLEVFQVEDIFDYMRSLYGRVTVYYSADYPIEGRSPRIPLKGILFYSGVQTAKPGPLPQAMVKFANGRKEDVPLNQRMKVLSDGILAMNTDFSMMEATLAYAVTPTLPAAEDLEAFVTELAVFLERTGETGLQEIEPEHMSALADKSLFYLYNFLSFFYSVYRSSGEEAVELHDGMKWLKHLVVFPQLFWVLTKIAFEAQGDLRSDALKLLLRLLRQLETQVHEMHDDGFFENSQTVPRIALHYFHSMLPTLTLMAYSFNQTDEETDEVTDSIASVIRSILSAFGLVVQPLETSIVIGLEGTGFVEVIHLGYGEFSVRNTERALERLLIRDRQELRGFPPAVRIIPLAVAGFLAVGCELQTNLLSRRSSAGSPRVEAERARAAHPAVRKLIDAEMRVQDSLVTVWGKSYYLHHPEMTEAELIQDQKEVLRQLKILEQHLLPELLREVDSVGAIPDPFISAVLVDTAVALYEARDRISATRAIFLKKESPNAEFIDPEFVPALERLLNRANPYSLVRLIEHVQTRLHALAARSAHVGLEMAFWHTRAASDQLPPWTNDAAIQMGRDYDAFAKGPQSQPAGTVMSDSASGMRQEVRSRVSRIKPEFSRFKTEHVDLMIQGLKVDPAIELSDLELRLVTRWLNLTNQDEIKSRIFLRRVITRFAALSKAKARADNDMDRILYHIKRHIDEFIEVPGLLRLLSQLDFNQPSDIQGFLSQLLVAKVLKESYGAEIEAFEEEIKFENGILPVDLIVRMPRFTRSQQAEAPVRRFRKQRYFVEVKSARTFGEALSRFGRVLHDRKSQLDRYEAAIDAFNGGTFVSSSTYKTGRRIPVRGFILAVTGTAATRGREDLGVNELIPWQGNWMIRIPQEPLLLEQELPERDVPRNVRRFPVSRDQTPYPPKKEKKHLKHVVGADFERWLDEHFALIADAAHYQERRASYFQKFDGQFSRGALGLLYMEARKQALQTLGRSSLLLYKSMTDSEEALETFKNLEVIFDQVIQNRQEMRATAEVDFERVGLEAMAAGEVRKLIERFIQINEDSGWDFERMNDDFRVEAAKGQAVGEALLMRNQEGLIIGYSRFTSSYPKERVYLYAFAVDSAFQGRGYGRALRSETIRVMRSEGYRFTYSNISLSNHRMLVFLDHWAKDSRLKIDSVDFLLDAVQDEIQVPGQDKALLQIIDEVRAQHNVRFTPEDSIMVEFDMGGRFELRSAQEGFKSEDADFTAQFESALGLNPEAFFRVTRKVASGLRDPILEQLPMNYEWAGWMERQLGSEEFSSSPIMLANDWTFAFGQFQDRLSAVFRNFSTGRPAALISSTHPVAAMLKEPDVLKEFIRLKYPVEVYVSAVDEVYKQDVMKAVQALTPAEQGQFSRRVKIQPHELPTLASSNPNAGLVVQTIEEALQTDLAAAVAAVEGQSKQEIAVLAVPILTITAYLGWSANGVSTSEDRARSLGASLQKQLVDFGFQISISRGRVVGTILVDRMREWLDAHRAEQQVLIAA